MTDLEQDHPARRSSGAANAATATRQERKRVAIGDASTIQGDEA
jgi:hypothetical protein